MTVGASCVLLYTSLLSMSDVIHIMYRQPPKTLGAFLDFYRETSEHSPFSLTAWLPV